MKKNIAMGAFLCLMISACGGSSGSGQFSVGDNVVAPLEGSCYTAVKVTAVSGDQLTVEPIGKPSSRPYQVSAGSVLAKNQCGQPPVSSDKGDIVLFDAGGRCYVKEQSYSMAGGKIIVRARDENGNRLSLRDAESRGFPKGEMSLDSWCVIPGQGSTR